MLSQALEERLLFDGVLVLNDIDDFACLFNYSINGVISEGVQSVLAADYGSFVSPTSGSVFLLKNYIFLGSWLILCVYCLRQVQQAFVDFIITCCMK
jgi:hypothetical protein